MLCVRYREMLSTAQDFGGAVRLGNCIPYFHSTGHFLYPKQAQLYLQDMYKLEINGRSRLLNTLLRLMKTESGVSRHRGTQQSVLFEWAHKMQV